MDTTKKDQGKSQARRRLCISLSALVLGLVAAEVGLRVFPMDLPPLPEKTGQVIRKVAHAQLQFAPFEGGEMSVEYRESPDSEPRVVHMRVNADGFRGPIIERERKQGIARIACLGDSHTFGFGVDEGETWPDYLRADLRCGGQPAEVLNAGVGGYSTLQELVWMRRELLDWRPDVIVLQYFLNDADQRGEIIAGRDTILRWTKPGGDGTLQSLRDYSRLADVVCDGVYRNRGLQRFSLVRDAVFAEEQPGWVESRRALIAMNKEAQAAGIEFVVALFPFLVLDETSEGEPCFASHTAFETVKKLCAERGIHCIDAEPALLALDGAKNLRVSAHDFHANERAHAAFAGVVRSWLEERGVGGSH